jgi:dTMP kinase
MGKLIIIEGTDGSGKQTQSELLFKRLKDEERKIKKITFPDYDSDSSMLVKMYLRGDFGDKPGDVNPYVSSTFYTCDRFASFKMKWGKDYNDGSIILSDRYTTSNMVHQASKIEDSEEKDKYLKWLIDFEFNVYGLPEPDMVVFLNMSPEKSQELMKNRSNKFSGEKEKDIHEKDREYLEKSYNNAMDIAKEYGWVIIDCVDGERIKTIDEINQEIYEKVIEIL